MYRHSLTICAIMAAGTMVLAAIGGDLYEWAKTTFWQAAIFSLPAIYAYACRAHRLATAVVLASVCAVVALEASLVLQLRGVMRTSGPLVICTLLSLPLTAVLGGYLGYALMEADRQSATNLGNSRGKLVVVGMLAMALLAIVIIFVAGIYVSATAYAQTRA